MFLISDLFYKTDFVKTEKFNVGDIVWDKGHKSYGTVMNNYGDPLNGDGGEIRLDSEGNQYIFEYDEQVYFLFFFYKMDKQIDLEYSQHIQNTIHDHIHSSHYLLLLLNIFYTAMMF